MCPRATEMEEEAYDGQEFRNWNESSVVEVQHTKVFGGEDGNGQDINWDIGLFF